MGGLLKYLIIVFLILIILISGIVGISKWSESYTKEYSSKTIRTAEGELILPPGFEPRQHPIAIFGDILAGIILFGFPIFVIIMSALYLYKEKEGYFKSLTIPLLYVIPGFIISASWLFFFSPGEEGMLILYLWPQFLITLVLALIVNGIVLARVKNKK